MERFQQSASGDDDAVCCKVLSPIPSYCLRQTDINVPPTTAADAIIGFPHSLVHGFQSQTITRLQRILPPKMSFFVRQKVQISSKNLPQIPNFASLQCTILVYLLNFVKFRQKNNIFVTTASFRNFVSFSSETKFFGA